MDVANVGVRKRAEALDKAATESSRQTKRRKGNGGEDLAFSSSSSSLTHELDNFCKFPQANSIIQGDATGDVVHESQSSNFTSDGGASCCSSNGSAEAATHKNSTDLEESVAIEALSSSTNIYNSTRGSGETLSNQLQAEETFRQEPTSEISCFRRITVQNITPLEAELEEFFAVAEKKFRKQFTNKYNYDISKDEPLGGRYEWVPLKP